MSEEITGVLQASRKTPAPQIRGPVGAPRGVAKTAAHRAAIGEALRRRNAGLEPWQKRRSFRRFLDDDEAEDYRALRSRHGYSVAEALAAIGRADLIPLTERP